MTVELKCTYCRRGLRIKEKLIGTEIRCPACRSKFVARASDAGASGSDEGVTDATLDRIGRFRITAALGQGGFGKVYKAHDPILDREVALKVPKAGEKGAERLILEARAAAPLRHPNIVAVFEAGADGDNLYIATEYVDGQTLADRANQKPVDAQTAGEWVKSLAEALAYAHQEKVVHRDVKPQNVMIGAAGRAQLMDFGLALSGAAASLPLGEATPGDGASAVVGTPAYMSPEQARGDGEKIGPASDQYGLGAVFYELLTGQKPFSGGPETVAEIAAGKRPKMVRAIRPQISRDLEAVCLKAMAAEPKRRYPDCRALADDIGRWLNDELVRARRHSPIELLTYWARKRPALLAWTAAAVCLLALLLGSGAAYAIHLATRTTPTPLDLTNVGLTPPSPPVKTPPPQPSPGDDLDAEMHRYGRLLDRTRMSFRDRDVVLADRWLEQTRWDYRNWEYNYLRRIVTGGWKTIHTPGGEITAIAMHPSGKRFASVSKDNAIRIWNGETGEQLATKSIDSTVTSLAYSPVGEILAVATGVEISDVAMQMQPEMAPPPPAPVDAPPPPSDAPPPPMETPPPPVEAPSVPVEPAPIVPSPVYGITLLNGESLDTIGEYRQHDSPVASLAFSPDGRWIASGSLPPGSPIAPVSSPAKVYVWSAATLETEFELQGAAHGIRRISFTDDGKQVFASSNTGEVVVWNLVPAATNTAPATGVPAAPAASPSPTVRPAAWQMPASQPSNSPKALAPERRFSGLHGAVAWRPGGQPGFLAAPATGTTLLEQGRRRVAGDAAVIHRWPLHANFGVAPAPADGTSTTMAAPENSNLESEDVVDAPDVVYDLAVAGEPTPVGMHPMAAVGGDRLSKNRPGAITLYDPAYEHGAHVAHQGHASAVTAVAFRPDGKQFVSGDAEGTIKIWKAEVHPEVVKLGPLRSARRVAFGKDGRFVAVAENSLGWPEARGAVTMWGPDGKPVANAEKPRGAVKLFDIRDGRQIGNFEAGPGDVLGLAIDPGMEWVAAGGEDRQVHVWTLAGQTKFDWSAPGIVRCLRSSADGKLLAAACGSADGTAKGMVVIWRLSDGKQIAAWPAHNGDVLSIAFSPNGKQIASSGADRKVRLWKVADPKKASATMADYDGEIVDLAFQQPTGRDLAGAGYDPCRPDQPGHAIVWTVASGKQRLKISSLSGLMYGVAFSPDGRRLVTAGGAWQGSLARPGEVKVYDNETGIELLPLAGRPGRASKQELHYECYMEEETVMVTVPEQKTRTVQVPRLDANGVTTYETREETYSVSRYVTKVHQVPKTRMRSTNVTWEEPGAVLGIAFSGDGRSIAAACEDGTALVWDAETCYPHDTIRWDNGRLLCEAVSPNGELIATGGDAGDFCGCTGLIRIHNAKTGRLVREIDSDGGAVRQIAFLPDNRQIAIVCGCGGPAPAAACALPGAIPPVRNDVLQMAANLPPERPDRGEIWDVATGKRLSIGKPADTLSQAAKPAPAGKEPKWLAASKDDFLVVVTETESTTPALTLRGHRAPARTLTLADGRLVSAGADNQLKVWRIEEALAGGAECGSCSPARARTIDLKGDPAAYVMSVRFSADGKIAAVAGHKMRAPQGSHPVRIVDAATGEARSIGNHRDTVRGVAVSPDGSHIASVAQDQMLYVHTPEGGVDIQAPHPNKLMKVVYSRDGKRLATATAFDGQVYLWDTETKQEIRRFKAEPMTVFALAFDPEGKKLVTGGLSGAIKVWNAETGELVREWRAHEGTIQNVLFDSQGKRLVSCGHDKTVRLWTFEDGKEALKLDGFAGPAWDAAFSADEQLIAVGAHDPVVKLFNAQTGEVVKTLDGHGQGVWGLAFSPDGEKLACCGRETPLVVWNWRDGAKISSQAEAGECLAWRGDGLIVTGSVVNAAASQPKYDGIVSLFDAQTGEPVDTIEFPDAVQLQFGLSTDGMLVAVGRMDGKVLLWDRRSNTFLMDKTAHQGAVRGVAFHPTGQWFATGGHDGFIRFWSADGKEAGSLNQGSPVASLEFAPLGERLATGDDRRNALVWPIGMPAAEGWAKDMTAASTIAVTLPGHYGEVCGLSFNGDGSRLATTSRTYHADRWVGDLKVWEVASGKRLLSIPSHTWWDAEVAFHPTLPYIATTGRDHTLQMFHAETGQLLLNVPTNGYLCNSVAFRPDGERLLATVGGQVKLLDAHPHESPFAWLGHPAPASHGLEARATEQAAARWVLEHGGQVQVLIDGVAPLDIGQIAELPADRYVVSRITLAGKPEIGDADLQVLAPLTHLLAIRLDLPGLTDESAKLIAQFKGLQEVHLNGTQLTDEGLRSLGSLPALASLGVSGTKVTDEAVQAIKAQKPELNLQR